MALANQDIDHSGAVAGTAKRKTFASAAWQIVVADVSMSLDNVLAVAAREWTIPTVLIIGLGLSIALMGFAATFVARLLHKYRWIAYVGLVIILYVAIKMFLDGRRRPVSQTSSASCPAGSAATARATDRGIVPV